MSVLVSDPQVIIKISDYIYEKLYYKNSLSFAHFCPEIKKLFFLDDKESKERLCSIMYDINVSSYNLRYEENDNIPKIDSSFIKWDCSKYQKTEKMHFFKLLEFYLYQIEGECEDNPIIKELEKIKYKTMIDIISATDEYKSYKWGE